MGRPPCCEKVGIKKGPWTPEEDIVLVSYIQEHGPGNWRAVPTNTGLMRCSKSCRLRWTNYLRPGIKRGNFTPHEEGIIVHLQALLGNKWAAIATYLPQRTDNDIKNYWNTHLKKKKKKVKTFDSHNMEPQPALDPTSCHPFMSNGACGSTETPSAYASCEANISRLLEGWMRSSLPSLSQRPDDNTAGNPNGDRKIPTDNGKSSKHCRPQTIDGKLIRDHKVEHSIMEKSGSHNNNNNPPFSFLEGWLLDESAGDQGEPDEGVMELPPIIF